MTLKNVCKNVLPIIFAQDISLLLLVGADQRVASRRPKCGSSAPSSQLAKTRGLARSSYERETPGHEQTLNHFPLPFLHRSRRLQTLCLTSREPHERQCRHVGGASDWDMSAGRPRVTQEKTLEAPKIHPPLRWIMIETTSLVSTISKCGLA